jgi:hypothetical protein
MSVRFDISNGISDMFSRLSEVSFGKDENDILCESPRKKCEVISREQP